MSIRDIIEAALVSSGNSEESWAEYYDCPDGIEASLPYIEQAEARFIATFDPEHIALMEAVCEADDPEPGPIHCQLCGGAGVMSLRDCERCGGSGREPSWQRWKARQDLRDALTAYRKERGL